ncbi:hypothetical protein BC941DRAFT_414742 [Chlamydoabsidia padenii]|nr:hypothetical protein BC941DRAFT_414742 [Chlamydoabsidia padenii]
MDIYTSHSKCTCDKNRLEKFREPEVWKRAMNHVIRDMYNSTSVGVPTPDPHLGLPTDLCDYCTQQRFDVAFNTDPFGAIDALHYRQQRSEHILYRIYHKIKLEFDDINILRINKGVFVAQQARPFRYSDHKPSEHSSSWLDSFSNDNSFTPLGGDLQSTTAPVSDFDYNDLIGLISPNLQDDPLNKNNQGNQIPADDFIPYTYTLGARYTSLSGHQQDYMIQGAIPLWCQTLILFDIYSAQPPIRPNETRYGLITFAPHLPLTFSILTNQQIPDRQTNDEPEILLWYERFAMDNVGEEHSPLDDDNAYWNANERMVLDKLVYCHIPPDLAQLITSLGTTWTANQGYLLH